MKKLLLILVVSIAFLAIPQAAFPCSCLLRATPAGKSGAELKELEAEFQKNRVKEADAVFLGKVVSSTFNEAAGNFEVKFKLERTWKGTSGSEATVFTPDNCFRYRFSVGETYLVYAGNDKKDDSKLWTSICAGTLPSENAADILEIIGKGKKIKTK